MQALEPHKEIYYSENVMNGCRLEHLNAEERNSILRIIYKHKSVFFHEGDDLTFTIEVKHVISTTVETPIYTRISNISLSTCT